ncbi:Probable RNA-directed DNA polymerase from transposon BS [Eumeta japonica]|uniref:Probable RNA-directed DNA polymerase from transposon BS n=1 Tax=Eumeta variegata TaxID=151549 RepID=A0A4C1Z0F2_EUMVA|nr:Probable RNA-directed DNA polymerase from transposon BS [Eumeta japonica]
MRVGATSWRNQTTQSVLGSYQSAQNRGYTLYPHSKPDNSVAIDDAEIAECLADSIETQCSHASLHRSYQSHRGRVLQNFPRTQRRSGSRLTQRSQTLVKSLNTRKAPGLDGISNKTIKCFSIPLLSLLVAIFNACIKLFSSPAWKAEVIGIHKPGKLRDPPASYRPISLLSASPPLSRVCLRALKPERTVAVFFDVAKAFDRQTDISHLGMSALTRQDVLSEQEFLKAPPSLLSAVLRVHKRCTATVVIWRPTRVIRGRYALFTEIGIGAPDSLPLQRAIDELGQWFRKWRIEVNPTNQQPYNSSMKRFFDIAGSHPMRSYAAVDYQPPHPPYP